MKGRVRGGSSQFQSPKKSLSRNTKHQAPREAPGSKFQAPRAGGGLELGTWDFFGVWSLVFAVRSVSSVFRWTWSQEAQVVPDAPRAHSHVEIREPHPEQTRPGPEQVLPIETAHATIRFLTERRAGKLIEAATDEVPQGMTPEGVTAEQSQVQAEHKR